MALLCEEVPWAFWSAVVAPLCDDCAEVELEFGFVLCVVEFWSVVLDVDWV